MSFLSKKQRETLRAVCNTIKPGVYVNDNPIDEFSLSATDLSVPTLIERALAEREDETSRENLQLLLNVLDRRAFNGWLSGCWKRFCDMSPRQREHVMKSLGNSRYSTFRGALHSVKQLATFLAYAHSSDTEDNPVWDAYGYHGREGAPRLGFSDLPALNNDHLTTVDCDVLVIGSGAGGGVVAAELAAEGFDVVVVEKGKQYSSATMPNNELSGMREMYEASGSLKTKQGMIVLAGSTLGGGTTINWMTCLRPPEILLAQWAQELGFSAAQSSTYQDSIDAIWNRLGVNTDESHANPQNAILEQGCKHLRYDVSVIPRNARGCVRCDFCNFGCRFGAKQDTHRTFLQDAADYGVRIVTETHVDRVLHEAGRVSGAVCTMRDSQGHRRNLKVRCRAVVSAAGSIHTPAILLRSGLSNPNIGSNLFLHPVGAVYALYKQRIESWRGAPQTRVSEHFADLDGEGYGFRLETSPAHPGLWALGLPWQSADHHRDLMRRVPHLGNLIVLTRDKHPGTIRLDRKGRPRLDYRLHEYDAQHLMKGVRTALRVQRAAGAEEVFGPHNDSPSFRHGTNLQFERFLDRIERMGTRSNHFGMFCAHQMASCRIAGSAKLGALNPHGESYEVRNLFVADASALPTSTGVNPMISIMANAHHVAQNIKAHLSRSAGIIY